VGFLKEDIIIARLTGDGKKELLIEPDWSLDKRRVLNTIRHTLKIRGLPRAVF
jgi:radical SAM superfamily enzyme